MALTTGGAHAQALDARERECAQGAWYTIRWVVAEGGGRPAQPKPEPGILALFGRSLMAVAEARDRRRQMRLYATGRWRALAAALLFVKGRLQGQTPAVL